MGRSYVILYYFYNLNFKDVEKYQKGYKLPRPHPAGYLQILTLFSWRSGFGKSVNVKGS